jgi:hypothetical protein
MSPTDTAAAWLADHPVTRRALIALLATHTLALWSVITAPHAAADTGAAALGWTGLKDTDGVPLGDYFLSVVDTPEAVANNGQPLSLLDPTTIPNWVAQAAETAATHATAAWWLTNEAAAFVFIVGISLWFLRFTLSSGWLVGLAQIGRPVYIAVNTLANQMWLGPLAVTACICVGGFHMMAGRRGRGWAVIGSGAALTVLLATVFRDPITDLFSDHGLLAAGRAAGFQLAEATRNGSYAPGQPLDTQLNILLAQLITAAVRQPLQVFNFGTVVDTIGTCRAAWSAAVIAAPGQGPGPAHAMTRCGAPQALAHAQHLGADDFVLGVFFLAVAALVGLFFWYVGITVLLVGLKALFFGVVAGPAFLVGITGLSRAVAYAKHCGWQLFSHALQMTAFTAFLGITTIAMSWVLTTGLIPVVPRMLLLGLAAVAAALLFRFIDHSFHTDGIGTIAHQIRSAAAHAARNQVNEERDRVDRVRRPISRSEHPDKNQYDVNEGARGSGAEFPTVTPRPTHTRTPAAATADADTAPARSTAAAPPETGSAAGETSAAAPEVVIPVVAAVAVAEHAHTHQHGAPHPGPAGAWPDHHRPAHPHTTTGTRAAEPFAAPPLAPPAAPAADELPLEFPSTAPRQRPRTPEGDPT